MFKNAKNIVSIVLSVLGLATTSAAIVIPQVTNQNTTPTIQEQPIITTVEQPTAPTSEEIKTSTSKDPEPSITEEAKTHEKPEELEAPKDIIEEKIETKTVTIDYKTQQKEDATLAKGETKVVQKGVDGEITKYYVVTYKNGTEIDRALDHQETTKAAVDEIIAVGTYVAPAPAPVETTTCPNGTYVNTAGNTVCRPAETNTGGATAICKDGTYSYSQSRRGTCSHHGGVQTWL